MKKVIIVGAGVSGLAAGRLLVDSGKFEVKVLEGDARVGGRIHTKPLGDHFIENGAQFVHGEKGNKIFEMAHPKNLLDLEGDGKDMMEKFLYDTVYVTNENRILEKPILEKVGDLLGTVLEGPGENDCEGSLGDWASKAYEKAGGFNLPEQKCLNGALLDYMHRTQIGDTSADSWFLLSVRGRHEYWECEGNSTIPWKAPYCYSALLSLILNDKPTAFPTVQPEIPNWIEVGKEVVKIEIVNDSSVSVHCSDGSQYSCDHLISTVSLGVLKHSHNSLFHPALPPKKVEAIENLGIGVVDKLHFDFGKRWWPEGLNGFALLWEDADSAPEYWRSDIDVETLKKEVGGLPVWTRNIIGFYTVPSHPTVLNSWITGPAARLVESMTEEEARDGFMRVLRHFLKCKFEVPDPVGFCRATWATNRFVRGSYSFRQMKSEKKDVWAKDLARPIMNGDNTSPLICFAGEATHDHYYATVHGAYETGIREANRLINMNSN